MSDRKPYKFLIGFAHDDLLSAGLRAAGISVDVNQAKKITEVVIAINEKGDSLSLLDIAGILQKYPEK